MRLLWALALIFVSVFVGAQLAAQDPKGNYCGGVEGIVELKVNVLNATHFLVTGYIFGSPATSCTEPYKFNRTTNEIWLPLTEPDDCIGQQLNNVGVDPESVVVMYLPDWDSLDIQSGFGGFYLDQCGAVVKRAH